ncbi:MAG: hypothetical protein JST42_03320, partial [Bacteroidetes bacterium]|nr:hypothetical protein [Bacteroidota bacterium]
MMDSNGNSGRLPRPAAAQQSMALQNAVSGLGRLMPAKTVVVGKATAAGKPEAGQLVTGGPAHPLGTTACIDTMGHILTAETNNTELGVDYITKTRDGCILAPGYRWSVTTPFYTFPYLVKYTQQGSIAWAKSFDGLGVYPQNYAYAYKCFELIDGTLLMVGGLDIPEMYNGRTELAVWRLDANGDLIWAQTDSCSFWTQYSGSLDVIDLTQDAAGNIYLAGNQRAFDAVTTGSFALKMDLAGKILWDQNLTSRMSSCFGMVWTGNELALTGCNWDGNNLAYFWCMKLNPATGDTLRSRTWAPDYGTNSGWNDITGYGRVRLLDNGNIGIFGNALSAASIATSTYAHGIVAEFDPSFTYKRGWMLRSNVQSNYSNTMFTEHPSGRISYSYLKYVGSWDADIFYGAIEHGQVVKERVSHQRNRSSAFTSNFVNFSGNEDILLQSYGDPVTNSSGHEFIRLHDSDTSSLCSGRDTLASWVEPYLMRPYRGAYWESMITNGFRKTQRVMPPPVDGTPAQETACKSLSVCGAVRVTVDHPQVCAGSPVVFTALRNQGCGSRPTWIFDTTNIQSYSLLNDTAIQLVYRDQFQGPITAAMTGTCSSLNDSKQLTVLPADKPVSLGGDAYLCKDSILVLRATKGYSSYLWQDGSAEDTLLVTMPGTYTVSVTNTCGVPSSDQVKVMQAPDLNFSVGSDI